MPITLRRLSTGLFEQQSGMSSDMRKLKPVPVLVLSRIQTGTETLSSARRIDAIEDDVNCERFKFRETVVTAPCLRWSRWSRRGG
jgi:hypothetical protein